MKLSHRSTMVVCTCTCNQHTKLQYLPTNLLPRNSSNLTKILASSSITRFTCTYITPESSIMQSSNTTPALSIVSGQKMEAPNGKEAISLRLMDLNDVDDMMVWGTDPKVALFCRWEPYTTREASLEHIRTSVISHPYHRAICVHNRAIGAITVTKNSGEDSCRGELGYVVASEWWGKGIATRAVKLVVATIFEEWPQLERLEALVDVENVGSQKVLEKVGFTREGALRRYVVLKGRTRDMVMFSFLCSDPRPV